ncbi:glycosyltransferase [Myxococcota bacterium]|nr:glycosyltransferase [Myxococcota bacterium]MBU1431957.1 glycosyltransferase [Myxococcota bacterium]MBU1898285.1 glycosyltransferase [Myxococcota bacterium]
MSRPHVVHVYNWLTPRNGGPPRVIAGLCAGQRAAGWRISLISSDHPGDPEVEGLLQAHLDPPPPRLSVRPKSFWPLLSRPALIRALSGADVVHLHGVWPPVILQAARICWRLKIPYVLSPHGSLHRGALAERWPRKRVGMHLLGYGQMVRRAAALHALNEEERDGVAWVKPPALAEIIPNGVDPAGFAADPDVAAFRASVPGLGDAPYVLFLSRLHWGKGLDLLGAAFREVAAAHPSAHLVVVGGDQGGAALLRAEVGGLEGRVHITGPRWGAEKDAAIKGAAVFCLPSRHEGFSMAITEALAWGRPVVISQQCHFPQVVTSNAGWVTPLRAADLAAALRAALADPATAEAMGARGRALVLSQYTWPVIAGQMIDLYQRAMELR